MNINMMHNYSRILRAAVVLLTAAVLSFVCYQSPKSNSSEVLWLEQEIMITDSNTNGFDRLSLMDKQVTAYANDSVLWTSPENFCIQQMLWCDIDRDQADELVLLAWKIGRFGPARPFWVKEDVDDWTQHIYIYDWDASEMRMDPIWMASEIGMDAASMSYDNKRQLLLVKDLEEKTHALGWLSWGLTEVDTSITLFAAGDNLIHTPIMRIGLANDPPSFDFLYTHIKSQIEAADLAILNQETPLVAEPSLYGDFPRFGTPVELAQAVKNAGFDAVTCANNHALDRAMLGIDTTVSAFSSLNVSVLGIQSSTNNIYEPFQIINCKGTRFALLNYTESLNGQGIPKKYPYAVHILAEHNKSQIEKDLENARKEADLIIVFAHWGTEYAHEIDEDQKQWTQFFLENDVDVVIGTHPHVTQSYELLTSDDGHQMLVYYSLGNFMSAQDQVDRVLGECACVTFSLQDDHYGISDYETLPIITHQEKDYYSVFPLDEYPNILGKKHRLEEISKIYTDN